MNGKHSLVALLAKVFRAIESSKPSKSRRLRLQISRLGLLTLAGLMLAHPASSQEQYTLQHGDTLSVKAATAPDLDRSMTIDSSGLIAFPLLGEVKAAGLTLEDVRAEVYRRLPDAFYRQRVGNEEQVILIRPQEISVEIEKYRPIYVDGAVRRAGELEYRFGLTVRQAIAASGGLSSGPVDASVDITMGLVELDEKYRALNAELTNVTSELASIDALRAERAVVDDTRLRALGLEDDVVRSLAEVSNLRLAAELERSQNERRFKDEAVTTIRDQIMAVMQQTEGAAAAFAAEEQEVQRVLELFNSGLYSPERLAQARRTLLQTNSQLLSLRARVAELKSSERELVRDRLQFDLDREKELLDQFQSLTERANTLSAQLDGLTRQRAILNGNIQSDAPLSSIAHSSAITIYRSSVAGQTSEAAEMETLLRPGDVVMISADGL